MSDHLDTLRAADDVRMAYARSGAPDAQAIRRAVEVDSLLLDFEDSYAPVEALMDEIDSTGAELEDDLLRSIVQIAFNIRRVTERVGYVPRLAEMFDRIMVFIEAPADTLRSFCEERDIPVPPNDSQEITA